MSITASRPPAVSANLQGILLMLVAASLDAVLLAAVRYLSAEIHPFELAFWRNIIGFFTLTPWFLRHGLAPFRTAQLRLHMLRAVLNVGGMLLFFTALSLIPMPKAQALLFTAPLFATILAVLVLGERIRLRRLTALAVGFCGALVVIRPGFQQVDPGSFMVLGCALLWGATMILIKYLGRRDSAITITVYMTLLMTPLSLVPALFVWTGPTPTQLLIIGTGAVAATLGQLAMAQAFRLAEMTVVMPLDFTKLIFGSILAYALFRETIDWLGWVGAVVIFGSAFYVAYRERQVKRRLR